MNIKSTLLIILLCIIQIHLIAQSSIIGKVYYHNSNSKPAANVYIIGKGSNNDYSKSDGSFELYFEQKQPGDRITLSTSNNRNNGKKLIITNKEAIAEFRIPSKKYERFKIVVEDSIAFEKSTDRFKNKIISFQKAELKKLRNKLTTLTNEKQKQKSELSRQIQTLEKNLIKSTEELDKISIYLAQINRDDAGPLLTNVLDKITETDSVDIILKLLNPDKLYKLKKSVLDSLQKSTIKNLALHENLKNIHRAYEVRKNLLLSINRFDDAINCMTAQISLQEIYLIDSMKLAKEYGDMSELLFKVGRYTEAKGYAKKLLRFIEGHQGLIIFEILASKIIDEVDYLLSSKRDDQFYLNQASKLWEKMLNENIQSSYQFVHGKPLLELSTDSKSIHLIQELFSIYSINITENDISDEDKCTIIKDVISIIDSLDIKSVSLWSQTLKILCDEENALVVIDNLEKILNEERSKENKSIDYLLNIYENLELAYSILNDYKRVLDNIESKIKLREQYSTSDDVEELPNLYLDYGYNLSVSDLDSLIYYNKAVKYFNKAIKIQKNQLSPFHFDLANTYTDYGQFLFEFEHYEKSKENFLKAVDIKTTHLSKISNELYYDYGSLASIYRRQNNFKKQEYYLILQIEMQKLYFDSLTVNLHYLYEDMKECLIRQKRLKEALKINQLARDILVHHQNINSKEFKYKYIPFEIAQNEEFIFEAFLRCGDLENGKILYNSYLKQEPSQEWRFLNVQIHIALSEGDKELVLKLIKETPYFNEELDVYPESIPELRKIPGYDLLLEEKLKAE